MATLNTTNIKHASSSSNNIVLASDGKVTFPQNTGNILQVVHTKKTDAFTTTSQTYVDLMTATITPSASSNKILIRYGVNGGTNGDINHPYITIYRDSTDIGQADAAGNRSRASSVINTDDQSTHFYGNEVLDSPSSTSAIVYRIKVRTSNGQIAYFNRSGRDTDLAAYDGRTTSFVTLMEVAA
tara:strand:+ start:704 stop:1255 length:552 start_codon:yes stop_codon:yes gene_type:complete